MAYVASLTRLSSNVRAEMRLMANAAHSGNLATFDASRRRLLEHLDADVRDVKADVEQLIVGGEW